jgi:hypothetical protein
MFIGARIINLLSFTKLMKISVVPSVIKFSLVGLLFYFFSFRNFIILYILITLIYPHIVAKICKVKVMPGLDMAAFSGKSTATANIITPDIVE